MAIIRGCQQLLLYIEREDAKVPCVEEYELATLWAFLATQMTLRGDSLRRLAREEGIEYSTQTNIQSKPQRDRRRADSFRRLLEYVESEARILAGVCHWARNCGTDPFTRDHPFDEVDLAHLWVAHGALAKARKSLEKLNKRTGEDGKTHGYIPWGEMIDPVAADSNYLCHDLSAILTDSWNRAQDAPDDGAAGRD